MLSAGRLPSCVTVSLVSFLIVLGPATQAEPDVGAVEAVLSDYLRAVYSRDAKAAYGFLSAADRDIKTLDDYAKEIGAFDGRALMAAKALADEIDFHSFDVSPLEDVIDVTFDVTLPNANDPTVRAMVHGFDPDRLGKLTNDEMVALTANIRTLASSGQLPVLQSEGESWSLMREGDQWRIFENWAEAVEVHFDAVTFHDLPWEFEPLKTRVMAKHGETIHMAYRAKNSGDEEITAKARHIIGPGDDADYLHIIACFCFLEETLAPGEEKEMGLTFRVDFEAPEEVTAFDVTYEFYLAEQFPGEHVAENRTQ